MGKVVLLNAFPINMLDFETTSSYMVGLNKMDLMRLKEVVEGKEVRCYIRHTATVEVLKKVLGIELTPSNEVYRYEEGDDIYVVTLKKPIRGQEVSVSEDDLIVISVKIVKSW